MANPIIVATAFLVVGLVIGTAAAFVFVAPPTRTQTQSVTITGTKTVLLTRTTTLTQQATTTSTQSITQFATSTSTSSITKTVTSTGSLTQFTNQTLTVTPTVTRTTTSTTTSTTTVTTTSTQTITSIPTGRTLVRNNGSSNANSPPFNASVADVQVNFNATATGGVSGVALAWYIYAVGNSTSTCSGSINAQQGSFVDYCYRLVPGSEYYIRISSTNANWSVDIVELD